MKKRILIPALLCFLYLFLFPKNAISSARDGLVLWYQSVLPVLFPFMLLCSLILQLNLLDFLPPGFYQPICRLFGCSHYGAFAMFSGFFCGFPMGAKITGDLLRQNKISRTEAKFLYGFVNNLSPGFILSYIAAEQLGDASLGFSLLVPVLGSAILYGLLSSIWFRYKNFRQQVLSDSHQSAGNESVFRAAFADSAPEKTYRPASSDCSASEASSMHTTSDSSFFLTLDDCIYDTIRSTVKLGAYITLFSILVGAFIRLLPQALSSFPSLLLLSCIEVTNGVRMLADSVLSFPVKYISICAIAAFGGLSALFQSIGISGLDHELLFYYIKSRVIITLLAICIAACSVLFSFFFL